LGAHPPNLHTERSRRYTQMCATMAGR
jgi:hypothetical protein